MVCMPVHARWLHGKRREYVRVTAEPLPDGVRSLDRPIGGILRLGLVDEATALPAFEQLVEAVKDRNPPPAGTAEPGAPTAEGASRPGERDPLSYVFPCGRVAQPTAIHQDDRIMLSPEVDRTGWLAITGPIPATRQPWVAASPSAVSPGHRWPCSPPQSGVHQGHIGGRPPRAYRAIRSPTRIIEIIWKFWLVST
jgi:hypothetical protein